jgi:two-component system sensor histidine kinase/response regulator
VAKILLVDDDPDFVNITRTVLQSRNHQVNIARNGQQALAAMRKEKPDVVLLDIMMSYVLDGVDVTHEMAADPALKDIPVIMVTSLASTPDDDVFPTDEHIAVEGWMSKPIKPDELLNEIDRVTQG